jgi:hypothetical protein
MEDYFSQMAQAEMGHINPAPVVVGMEIQLNPGGFLQGEQASAAAVAAAAALLVVAAVRATQAFLQAVSAA